jgi:hypothetical protein
LTRDNFVHELEYNFKIHSSGRRPAVKKLTALSIPVIFCMLSATAMEHRPTYPAAPIPLNSGVTTQVPLNGSRRIDVIQLQREADDLAKTAQSIPSDVESVRKGMLPKDVLQKLRQIEKLSKRLRSELNP